MDRKKLKFLKKQNKILRKKIKNLERIKALLLHQVKTLKHKVNQNNLKTLDKIK